MAQIDKCPFCGSTNVRYLGRMVPDNYCNDCEMMFWEPDVKATEEIKALADQACEMFYAGEEKEEILPILQKAKEIHTHRGGTEKNWIGTTDEREIWKDYPYNSI